jgi:hypothetical protein
MCAKTKIALAAALILGLCGTVMANDSGENHQDGGDAIRGGGHAAFAKHVVQSHSVNHHVKNSFTLGHEAASFDTWLPSQRGKPTPPVVRPAPNPFEKSDDFFW